MNKSKILIFYQVMSLRDQYNDLFPYQELSMEFEIKNFGTFRNHFEYDGSIKISRITRKIHTFVHYCELRRRRFSTWFYLMKATGHFPNRLHGKLPTIRIYNKAKFYQRISTVVFSNLLGSFLLNVLVETLFYLEYILRAKTLREFKVFIVPYTGGFSVESDFLLWLGEKKGIQTVCIQENWDNLSSKQFMIQFPKIFIVWGDQSGSHLRIYQNFEGEIIEAGCLRLQPLYELRKINRLVKENTKSSQPNSPNQILYVESGVEVGDLQTIIQLSKYFSESCTGTSNYKIIYRTYPWIKPTDTRLKVLNEIKSLKNVEVYEPVNESNSSRIQQIADSQIIISIFSTYVLEASILDKFCFLPTFGVDFETKYPNKIIDDLAHFQGMSLLSRVKTVTSIKELVSSIELSKNDLYSPTNDPKLLNWFCKDSDVKSEIIFLLKKLNSDKSNLNSEYKVQRELY